MKSNIKYFLNRNIFIISYNMKYRTKRGEADQYSFSWNSNYF